MGDGRIEVSLSEGLRRPDSATLLEVVRRATVATLATLEVAQGELSVCLMEDEGIAALNREWLDHDGPTDVIAFPLQEAGEPPVGDVYIGLDQAERQAADLDVSLEEELTRLAVHGTLHVLGFDHPEGEARAESEMWRRQEAIVLELMGGADVGS